MGNQLARPGGVRVSYTPFDLPRAITQGARTVSFGYDGDQQRIRKTTPDEETIYFGAVQAQSSNGHRQDGHGTTFPTAPA